jgi:hypothetical protein
MGVPPCTPENDFGKGSLGPTQSNFWARIRSSSPTTNAQPSVVTGTEFGQLPERVDATSTNRAQSILNSTFPPPASSNAIYMPGTESGLLSGQVDVASTTRAWSELSEADFSFISALQAGGTAPAQRLLLQFMLTEPRRSFLDNFVASSADEQNPDPLANLENLRDASSVRGQAVGSGETHLLLMMPTRISDFPNANGPFSNNPGEPLSRRLYGFGIAAAVVVVSPEEVSPITSLWADIW